MALEGFELLAVLETDDVIGSYRPLDRNERPQRLGLPRPHPGRDLQQSRMDLSDQARDFARLDRIVADKSRHDIGCQPDVVAGSGGVAHRTWPPALASSFAHPADITLISAPAPTR